MAAEMVPKVWMIMMSLSVLIHFQYRTEFVEEELSFLIFEFTEDINSLFCITIISKDLLLHALLKSQH